MFFESWHFTENPNDLIRLLEHEINSTWGFWCFQANRDNGSSGCGWNLLCWYLCFVFLQPGFSRNRTENGLKDVSPFGSFVLGAQWGSVSWGCFFFPSSLLTVCTTFFPWNLFTSFVIRVAFVSLGPIPTSFLAEARDTYLYHVTNKHLRSVLSHLECLLFQFGHQHGGDGSWHSTKGLQPPQGHLCLKREAERPRCPRLIHR